MSLASVIALLQAALLLLSLAQSSPLLPQSLRDQAVQTAQQAISQATAVISSSSIPTIPTPTSTPTAVSFSALPTSGAAPLTVTFNYSASADQLSSAGSTYITAPINFGDGTSGTMTAPFGEPNCSDTCVVTVSHSYTAPGVYTSSVKSDSRTITVTGGNMARPSATLDVSNMQFSTGGKDTAAPLITGSASNVSQVAITIKGGGATTNVVNGRWQAYLNGVTPGTYTIGVNDNDQGQYFNQALAQGVLTITAPVQPTPVITGTNAKAAGSFEADAGGELSILGNNLATTDSTYVYVGGYAAPITWVSSSEVHVTVPQNLTIGQSYDLYIQNSGGKSNVVSIKILGTTAPPLSESASLDVGSMSYQTPNFTITGSAVAHSIVVELISSAYAGSSDSISASQYLKDGSAYTAVENSTNSDVLANGGRWQVAFNGISVGTYKVYVYSGDGYTIWPLATGSLALSSPMVAINSRGLASCPANAAQQRTNSGQTYQCFCTSGFALGLLWGGSYPGGYYTDNSDICTAGMQAGQINTSSGGEVDYTIAPGQSSYPSWTANGITSVSNGSWPGSFQITGPKG